MILNRILGEEGMTIMNDTMHACLLSLSLATRKDDKTAKYWDSLTEDEQMEKASQFFVRFVSLASEEDSDALADVVVAYAHFRRLAFEFADKINLGGEALEGISNNADIKQG